MSITSIEIAFDLDEDCSPNFCDGKLRISVEDGTVSLHVNRKKDGTAYFLAEAPLADFQRGMALLGVIEQHEAAND